MDPVRIAIVGVGNMGSSHARTCSESPMVDLVGLCDRDPARIDGYDDVPIRTTDAEELLARPEIEAVLIATPHYDHTPIAIAAFEHGIHVLCEKPIGSQVGDVERTIDAYRNAAARKPGLQFGAVFQQRTMAQWQTIRKMLDAEVLGKLVRVTWIITDWFRTQFYYDMGEWRASWAGEGGGVLLNQCIHNLDLYQWFFGMPSTIEGRVALGKYHRIEVEDEVTALFQHADGMVGNFITSTAESPGTNRLEIVGELGKLVYEDGELVHVANDRSMLDAIRNEKRAFMQVDHHTETVALPSGGGSYRETIERFAAAVRGNGMVVAEGVDGLQSIMLANGILMSHFTRSAIDVPLDGKTYGALLDRLRGVDDQS